MADLDSFDFSILNSGQVDEELEHIRQIRLSRRVPVKTTRSEKTVAKKREAKKMPDLNADQAAEILKLLKGN